ncbi:MAG: helix-turn-helix domain-containing protein [Thermoanaerobaculia bacterium]|nr:helix-turn-helix domain-containing protein [Thermoanaerobaculia bacterium]
MKPILTPKDLADAIGVSESSIKRWADEGKLRATRTAGGHRRIAIADAIRFVRATEAILVRPEILGMSDLAVLSLGERSPGEDVAADLHRLLFEGAEAESRGLLLSLYLSGWSVAQIVDGPVQSALARIGDLWRHDEAGIFIEHRAVDLCMQGLSQIRSLLPLPNRDSPSATGGAPAGDPYLLPSLGIALALQEEGYRAVNLGPDCPYSTWLEACEQSRPSIFWLSCSSQDAAQKGVDRQLTDLLRALSDDVVVAVGGAAAPPSGLPKSPRLFAGSSIGELVAFVRGLRASGTDPS